MTYSIVKTRPKDIETITVDYRNIYTEFESESPESEEYFNLKIRNKNYPSYYQYNLLVMLAKKLIEDGSYN